MVPPIRKPRLRNAQDFGNHHHSNCLMAAKGCQPPKTDNTSSKMVLVWYVVHFRDPILLKHTPFGLMSHPKVVYFYHAWGRYHRNYGWDFLNRPLLIFHFGRKKHPSNSHSFWDAGGSGNKHPTFIYFKHLQDLSLNNEKQPQKSRFTTFPRIILTFTLYETPHWHRHLREKRPGSPGRINWRRSPTEIQKLPLQPVPVAGFLQKTPPVPRFSVWKHRKIIFQFPIFRFYANFRSCNCFCWVTPLHLTSWYPKMVIFFNELPFPTIFFGYPAVGFRGCILLAWCAKNSKR